MLHVLAGSCCFAGTVLPLVAAADTPFFFTPPLPCCAPSAPYHCSPSRSLRRIAPLAAPASLLLLLPPAVAEALAAAPLLLPLLSSCAYAYSGVRANLRRTAACNVHGTGSASARQDQELARLRSSQAHWVSPRQYIPFRMQLARKSDRVLTSYKIGICTPAVRPAGTLVAAAAQHGRPRPVPPRTTAAACRAPQQPRAAAPRCPRACP